MKPMPALAALLDKAKAKGIFGTKMRWIVVRSCTSSTTTKS